MSKAQVTLCTFNPCSRVVYAVTTGLCRSHHSQLKRGYELKPLRGEPVPCGHEGCSSLAASKGLCRTHYMQMWKYGYTYGEGSPAECSVSNCERPVTSLGMCQRHYLSGADHVIQGERNTSGVCLVRGCESRAAVDLCKSHANRAGQYGVSRMGLVRLLDVPGCPACGRENTPLTIHHDHKCCDSHRSCGGCILSPLCETCNRASGLIGDDPGVLEALARIARGPYYSESRSVSSEG